MAVAETYADGVSKTKDASPASEILTYETFLERFGGAGLSMLPSSPLHTAGWAKMIRRCYETWLDMGLADPAQPLQIVDMVADDGQFTFQMWQALQTEWHAAALTGTWRYIACLPAHINAELWRVQAGLEDLPGLICAAGEDSGWSWSVLPHHAPTVLLANGYLHHLPQALRASHYGQWMEGYVHVTDAERQGECEIEYGWEPLEPDAQVSASLQQRYLRSVASACVQVPTGAMRLLSRVADVSNDCFLWLAADLGVTDENQISLGALHPPCSSAEADRFSLVNFHALSFGPKADGAWVRHKQLQTSGPATQVIWRSRDKVPSAAATDAMTDVLEQTHIHVGLKYVELARALPSQSDPSLYLALLRACTFDVEILRPVLAQWMDAPPVLTVAEQTHWRSALWIVWRGCPRSVPERELRHALGVLAAQWGYLDLATRIFDHDGNDFGAAQCELLGGQSTQALARLRRANRRDERTGHLCREIDERMQSWREIPWYDPDSARDQDLSIEPLGVEHAEAFYQRYRDPHINILTRLPELDSLQDVQAWMLEQAQQPGRFTFAVMKADTGFIGVVSLHLSGDDGYFYFWIGADFQGKGYGRRASQLLCQQAMRRPGVQDGCLFTSVYRHNMRSIDALRAIGFHYLDVQAAAPDDDLAFYMLPSKPLESGLAICRERLASLLLRLHSCIELAA